MEAGLDPCARRATLAPAQRLESAALAMRVCASVIPRLSIEIGGVGVQYKERTMSFALYVIGFVIVIGGVAWGMIAAGISHLWVMIACVILLGIGIVTGVSRTRSKDPS
jgi:hypothetical protein